MHELGVVFSVIKQVEKIGEEILLNGEYKDFTVKKYNPHKIAKEVIKQL